MSDPPPRKVGSLRDRIAAFENKGPAPTPAPPPPRPKPGHVNWQPKPASPTSPRLPVKTDNDDGGERKPGAGMSAADAQQSIGKLSLKERMAALQGSTAFGGPAGGAGAPPPRPAGEKPKWKPPPVVQRVQPIGGEDEDDAAKPAVSPPATAPQDKSVEPARSPANEGETKKEKEEEGEGEPKEEGEPDPEEEERQRRAALAARMARLGGARVGMGPPIFGKKPDVPPKRLSKSEEKPKEEEVPKEERPAEVPPPAETGNVLEGPTVEEAAAIALPPSAAESRTEISTDYFPDRKGSGSAPSSLLSPEEPAAPAPVRSPYMPVPQVPKRAAPPRKRPAKSPSPVTPVLSEEFQESPSPLVNQGEAASVDQPEERGDRQPEVTEGQIEDVIKEVVPQAHEAMMVAEIEEPVVASEPESLSEAHEEPIAEPSVVGIAEELAVGEHIPELIVEEPQPEATSPAEPQPQTEDIHEAESETQHEEEPSPVPAPEEPAEEPEEDEAARRKRIAERLAKSGGFNPFAGGMPPPVRRESSDSARSPPPPPRRDSLQEARSPKPSLPERKASVGSVESAGARKSSLDVGAFTSEEPHIPDPSAPTARELHEEPIEEDYEDEEAEPRAAGHGAFNDHEESVVDEPDSEKYEDIYGHEVAHAYEITEEPENVEEVSEPAAPLPPPRATRPPPAVPQAQPPEVKEELKSPTPPPRRDFLPPPPRRVSVPPPPPPPAAEEFEEEHQPGHDDEADAYAQHAREVGPEHEAEEEYEDEYDERPEEEHEYHVEEEEPVSPPPPPPRHAPVPPPPPPAETYEEDEEEEPTPSSPPPPPRIPSRGNSLNVPPPLAPRPPPILQGNQSDEPEEDEEDEELEDEEDSPPPPPRSARPVSQIAAPPPVSATGKPVLPPLQRGPSFEEDMLDDTDGDPIDPRFYSPTRSPSSSQHVTSPQSMTFPLASPPRPPARMVSPPPPPPPPQRILSPPPAPEQIVSPSAAPSSPPPPPPITSPRLVVPPSEPQEEKGEDEEDSEQVRRRTIAERMAKLGGIHFGAPPPVPSARRAPAPEPEPVREEAEDKPAEAEEAPQEEEEDEFARKQRIAARIAGMGGMRFGMMPGAAPPKPPPRVQHDEEEEESVKSPPPPKRSAPVPPPPPPPPAAEEDHGSESDYQHVSDSDRIEHEESELEEVTHEDAEEEAPPVPDRHGRRVSSGPPPVPQARPLSFASAPPVPRTRPPAPPAFTYPPPPHAPHPLPTTTETHGDFVVVDQPQSDEPPPPPPPRGARPPGRAPPRAPPAAPEAESQWETPSIPNIDFGGGTDLSLSAQWSEDSTNYPPAPPSVPPPASHTETEHPLPPAPSHPPPSERNFTADELQAQWGRVGVQVHEIAATLFEKSKKSLVGDGSYRGFVAAVIGQVPNAAQPAAGALDSFGYLVYSQAGGAVQRRVSDIMPGDVIVVSEAKFKGHKGLQSYSQTVGVGEPLVGIIGDFEMKKSKVKVYQANQHVGQQSVETVSYRLEDLKSGAVKIYRVLEA